MRAMYDSKTKTMDDHGIRVFLTKEAKYQSWLDVEAALAKAQGELGIIPKNAADKINEMCKLENIDFAEMDRIYQEIGHGFVPFLKVLVKACGKETGKFVHYGATTQNIQQSAQLLNMYRIHQKLVKVVANILENLADLAEKHKNTVMAGRTHGRHAIPITYGYKVSIWINDFIDTIERLREAEKRVFQIMMGGAIGAFNSLGEEGRKVQQRVADILGMHAMEIPSRNINAHKIEYIMNLALLASNCHKIAEEVYTTSIEEYGEVSEGFKKGTIGSSTMPHKINPKLSKGIIANSQKIYSLPQIGLVANARPFEADSSSYMVFEAISEEAISLIIEIILRTEELTRDIIIHKEKMYENVLVNKGLDNSEYIMMKIAEKIGKEEAHSLLYRLAMESITTKKEFAEVLMQDEKINSVFTIREVEEMLKPESYIGLSEVFANEMAKKARLTAELIDKQTSS